MRDDEEDDVQSFAEDEEVLVQRQQLQLDPLVAVSTTNPRKSVPFGTTSGSGGGELARENDLIPISVGGLNPQMDHSAKKIDVAPNSNSGKGDYPIPIDSAHISSNSTLNLKDNLENPHASKHCDKAETYVTEKTEIASSNKAPILVIQIWRKRQEILKLLLINCPIFVRI